MFSCFQLTSPTSSPLHSRTRSPGSHQGERGGWWELSWWLDLGPQALALTPWPFHSLLEGRRGRRPHIPREGLGGPRSPLGRKSGERGVAHRPVPLGPTHASPPQKNNPFLLSGNILLRDLQPHTPPPPPPT